MTEEDEVVRQGANVLLNLFQQLFQGDRLVPIVMKILEQTTRKTLQQQIYPEQINMVVSCLEVLMVLLKDTQVFAQKTRNVKNCVTKICELASDNYGNQMITMPVIGSLLTLRDKNLSATMDSLAKIDT